MAKITLLDNTRVSAHRRCRRKYYWRHVRHLVQAGQAGEESLALVFGGAWHKAMDIIWRNAGGVIKPDSVIEAIQAFNIDWTKRMGYSYDSATPDQRKAIGHRNPVIAAAMLQNYVIHRQQMIANCELLAIEQPFAIPLFEDRADTFYTGRFDKAILWNHAAWPIEHKTTTMCSDKSGFRATWVEQWEMNSQVDGYHFAMRMIYSPSYPVRGVVVDGAGVNGASQALFHLKPVQKDLDALAMWHYNLVESYRQIVDDKIALSRLNPEDPIMQAYPQNTNACMDFMRTCEYMTLCIACNNPHSKADSFFTSTGYYRIEPWSPFDEAKLEALGLKKEDVDVV